MDYRSRLEPVKTGKAVVFGIFLILAMLVGVFFLFNNKSTGIEERGVKVSATVVSVEKILKRYDVTVKYENANGGFVEANLVNRSLHPSLGSTIDVYVSPDDPYTAYSEESSVLKYVVLGLLGFIGLLGIVIVAAVNNSAKNYKLLKKSGISGECSVTNVTPVKDNNGAVSQYFVQYSFADENGNLHDGETSFDRRPPQFADRFPVVYARKSNGKYISQLIK